MIPSVLHPMTPFQLAIHKHPLASVLTVITSFEHARTRRDHVRHALQRAAENARVDIAGLVVAHGETARHPKLGVQSARRVAVNGKWCPGTLFVACNRRWLTAADNSQSTRRIDTLEVSRWESLGEIAHVVFAVLLSPNPRCQ